MEGKKRDEVELSCRKQRFLAVFAASHRLGIPVQCPQVNTCVCVCVWDSSFCVFLVCVLLISFIICYVMIGSFVGLLLFKGVGEILEAPYICVCVGL